MEQKYCNNILYYFINIGNKRDAIIFYYHLLVIIFRRIKLLIFIYHKEVFLHAFSEVIIPLIPSYKL